MAKLIELEEGVFVAPQLIESDMSEVAARGFRAVVNIRPDGEAAGQMPNAVASRAATGFALDFQYQPVASLNVTDDDVVAAFRQSLETLPRPVLFYCQSGTRCTILWAQASVARLGAGEVTAIAARAGYDLSAIADILEERGQSFAGASKSVTSAT